MSGMKEEHETFLGFVGPFYPRYMKKLHSAIFSNGTDVFGKHAINEIASNCNLQDFKICSFMDAEGHIWPRCLKVYKGYDAFVLAFPDSDHSAMQSGMYKTGHISHEYVKDIVDMFTKELRRRNLGK